MEDSHLADVLIARLNALLCVDRAAISNLINQRVPCNDAMARHRTVQVSGTTDSPKVGFLGLLNGLVGKIESGPGTGSGYITAIINSDGTIKEFKRTHVCVDGD